MSIASGNIVEICFGVVRLSISLARFQENSTTRTSSTNLETHGICFLDTMTRIVLKHVELLEVARKRLESVELARKRNCDIEACVQEIGSTYPTLKTDNLTELRAYIEGRFLPEFRVRWLDVLGSDEVFKKEFAEWLDEVKTLVVEDPRPQFTASAWLSGARPKPKWSKTLVVSYRSVGDRSKSEEPNDPDSGVDSADGEDCDHASLKETFTLMAEMGLNGERYEKLRLLAESSGRKFLPSSEVLRSAEELCFPAGMQHSDSSSRVKLQDLLDHTAQRLLSSLPEEQILHMSSELTLTARCGSHDSSSYRANIFKPLLPLDTMFLIAVTPERLEGYNGEPYFVNTKQTIQEYCRPLELVFNSSRTPQCCHVDRVEGEIGELKPLEVKIRGKLFVVRYKLVLTRVEPNDMSFESAFEELYIGRRERLASLSPRVLCKKIDRVARRIFMDLEDVHSYKQRRQDAINQAFERYMVLSDPCVISASDEPSLI